MILTKQNVLLNKTPTITSGASSDAPKNITNQDFSVNYTSSNQQGLVIEFGATSVIDYVAVAGVTVASSGAGRVILSNGGLAIQAAILKRNNVVVFSFPEQSFSNLKIALSNDNADRAPTVSFIAAGSSLIVPNSGETGGHARSWLSRKFKSKAATNGLSAPVSVLRKTIQTKGSLNIPNMGSSFSQNELQEFLDFAENNLFFINEDSTKPESSYCCYELTDAKVKTHGSTRNLNDLTLKFNIFTGI